jgi:hypothetical protein
MALYTDRDITKTAMTLHEMEFACFFVLSLQNLWKFLLKEVRVTFQYGISLVEPVLPGEPSFH